MKLTQIVLIASLFDQAYTAGTIADGADCGETTGMESSCQNSGTFCCGRLKPQTVDGTQKEMCKEKASNGSVINVDGKSYLFWCNSYAELKASTLVLGAGAAAISATALM